MRPATFEVDVQRSGNAKKSRRRGYAAEACTQRHSAKLGFTEVERFAEYDAEQWFGYGPLSRDGRLSEPSGMIPRVHQVIINPQ